MKSVTDWHASNVSRLFPNGLNAFSDKLDLPLQLYTPFFADDFVTPYNTTESTSFRGTKIVTPRDSYKFYSDLFDLGNSETGGRMKAYECDFLMDNFAGSASMFESVTAASEWYRGMADAALERDIAVQYCLCSATDVLESLSLPAVVQARASGDYVNKQANPFALGGSSLLMGALKIAPSKDTLWTASPQPGTMSDTEHNGLSYTTQPHVQLDAVLATLSLGPVGISDGLGQVGVALIQQSFRSANDSTLLRPSRPLSWTDGYLLNQTYGRPAEDVRSTHAAVSDSNGGSHNSHVLVAWATGSDAAVQVSELYPAPDSSAILAVREHVLSPVGPAQSAGCTAGASAVPSCIQLVQVGDAIVVPATGTNISSVSVFAVYEPLSNGAYFLGELNKFVHVSPQRFDSVAVGGNAAAGISSTLRGTPGEMVTVFAVGADGIVRSTDAVIGSDGAVTINL